MWTIHKNPRGHVAFVDIVDNPQRERVDTIGHCPQCPHRPARAKRAARVRGRFVDNVDMWTMLFKSLYPYLPIF